MKWNKNITIHTGNFIYGLSPIKREDPEDGQSEWYYLDPRNASTFSDFKKIDVPSQNTPNPYAKEIQSYIFKTNPEVYKILYGNAEPESAQNNQQPQAAQTENSGNIPSFSEQNANNIFPQPQSAVGQAVHNNVTQQPANGIIKTQPEDNSTLQVMKENSLIFGNKEPQTTLQSIEDILKQEKTLTSLPNPQKFTVPEIAKDSAKSFVQGSVGTVEHVVNDFTRDAYNVINSAFLDGSYKQRQEELRQLAKSSNLEGWFDFANWVASNSAKIAATLYLKKIKDPALYIYDKITHLKPL